MVKIVAFNKPFNVHSQFRSEELQITLSDFIHDPNLRIAGRLDRDSEGLLLLTDDGQLNQQITHPKHKQYKSYVVQVEGDVSENAIEQLRRGVMLKDGMTLPAKAEKITEPKWLWERDPPIRHRANIPTSWIEIQICEGKNRQVRRMTAAVGFPTLRLIRTQIGSVNLLDLGVGLGESTPLEALFYDEFRHLLKQKNKTQDHAKSGLSWKDQQRKNQNSKDHSNNGFKPNKTKSKNSQTEKSDSRQKSGNPSSARRDTNNTKPSNRRATTKQRNKE
uniref:rRNA large subunit pseudouridine synthase E n=1 Tax=uncultured Acinetobacter sp. TaxID=165433 RepID=UPI0034216FC8